MLWSINTVMGYRKTSYWFRKIGLFKKRIILRWRIYGEMFLIFYIQALLGLSYTLMARGKFNDAQNYINMLLKEDESNEEALALLVSVLNAKKDNESALDYLVGMIQRQPNSYHLIELYISILLRSGDISNAKDVLYKSERTLKFTYTPGLYFCKGLYHKYLGETNKALIEFSKAKTDEEYGIKCIEQILEIYINPDSDKIGRAHV